MEQKLIFFLIKRLNRCDDDGNNVQLKNIIENVNTIRLKLFDFLLSNEAKYLPDAFTGTNATFINKRNFSIFHIFGA